MVRILGCWLAVSAISSLLQSTPAQDAAQRRKQILEEINGFRKLAGVDAIVEKETLSKGCQLHAKYLNLNKDKGEVENGGAHREAMELPGYTEEGAKSAARSLVGYAGVSRLMASVYHREPLLNPCLTSVGIGCAGDTLVIDVQELDYARRPATHPVIYPAPDQTDVPLGFCLDQEPEWPDPRPATDTRAGFPITIQFLPIGWRPKDVEARLLSPNGKEIDVWLSTPQKPARADREQGHLVCLLPKNRLEPGVKYTVTFKCKQIGVEKTPEWTKTWSFTTVAPKK